MSLSACLLSNGTTLECRNSNGGIQTIWIAPFTEITYTLSADESTIVNFVGIQPTAYAFYQPVETSSWTSEGQFSTENGSSFYRQKVELTLHQMNATNNLTTNILGQGTWRILILDQNNRYFLIGLKNGARVISSTPGAGKAMGDLNGAVITFEALEDLTAYFLDTPAALQFIGP